MANVVKKHSISSELFGIPTLARVAAYGGGFPIKVDGEIVGPGGRKKEQQT